MAVILHSKQVLHSSLSESLSQRILQLDCYNIYLSSHASKSTINTLIPANFRPEALTFFGDIWLRPLQFWQTCSFLNGSQRGYPALKLQRKNIRGKATHMYVCLWTEEKKMWFRLNTWTCAGSVLSVSVTWTRWWGDVRLRSCLLCWSVSNLSSYAWFTNDETKLETTKCCMFQDSIHTFRIASTDYPNVFWFWEARENKDWLCPNH